MNEPGSFSTWLTTNTHALVLWTGAICTLGLYSVLYKENKIFRFFEHLFLGLATGYMIAVNWNDVLLPKWWTPFREGGEWWWAFALLVGTLFYFIYSKKYNWMARMVIGLFLGVGAGQQFQAFVNDVWPQIYKSFKPMIAHRAIAAADGHKAIPELNWGDARNNIIFMAILLCVMSYFFFSFEQKHVVLKKSAQTGRFLMMFTFGAIFGQTIMARLALLIDRMDFLMNIFGTQVAGVDHGPTVIFSVLMALTAFVLYLSLRKGGAVSEESE
jgi:hypothetical protein